VEIQTSVFQFRIGTLLTVNNYRVDDFSGNFDISESKFVRIVFELFKFIFEG